MAASYNTSDRYRTPADAVIVGGGASGLAAAIGLGMDCPGLDVVVLEKNEEPGRKIRATGSGRCNITNTSAEGYTEIMAFFRRIGLVTRTYENGLVYPYSESAADVAELLAERALELGTGIITGAEVTAVRKEGDFFTVEYNKVSASGKPSVATIRAYHVILACGGKAGPTYGTTGDGYRLARELGHSVVTPVPVLTGIECSEWGADHDAAVLAGTRTRGKVRLYRNSDVPVFEEAGEIQFTRYGLSGICVFNMTRHMRYDRRAGEAVSDFEIRCDLFPDGEIREFLRDRRSGSFPGEKISDILRTVLKPNIAGYILTSAGIRSNREVSDLTERDIDRIGSCVHELRFHPSGIRGWKEAQATAGGVSLDEIDPETCESRITSGLYITGELADRDFRCGGFNLSNAWLTGLRAARAIAEK